MSCSIYLNLFCQAFMKRKYLLSLFIFIFIIQSSLLQEQENGLTYSLAPVSEWAGAQPEFSWHTKRAWWGSLLGKIYTKLSQPFKKKGKAPVEAVLETKQESVYAEVFLARLSDEDFWQFKPLSLEEKQLILYLYEKIQDPKNKEEEIPLIRLLREIEGYILSSKIPDLFRWELKYYQRIILLEAIAEPVAKTHIFNAISDLKNKMMNDESFFVVKKEMVLSLFKDHIQSLLEGENIKNADSYLSSATVDSLFELFIKHSDSIPVDSRQGLFLLMASYTFQKPYEAFKHMDLVKLLSLNGVGFLEVIKKIKKDFKGGAVYFSQWDEALLEQSQRPHLPEMDQEKAEQLIQKLKESLLAKEEAEPQAKPVSDLPKKPLELPQIEERNELPKDPVPTVVYPKKQKVLKKLSQQEFIFRFQELSRNPFESDTDPADFWGFEPVSKQTVYAFSKRREKIVRLEKEFGPLQHHLHKLLSEYFFSVNVRLPGLILNRGSLTIGDTYGEKLDKIEFFRNKPTEEKIKTIRALFQAVWAMTFDLTWEESNYSIDKSLLNRVELEINGEEIKNKDLLEKLEELRMNKIEEDPAAKLQQSMLDLSDEGFWSEYFKLEQEIYDRANEQVDLLRKRLPGLSFFLQKDFYPSYEEFLENEFIEESLPKGHLFLSLFSLFERVYVIDSRDFEVEMIQLIQGLPEETLEALNFDLKEIDKIPSIEDSFIRKLVILNYLKPLALKSDGLPPDVRYQLRKVIDVYVHGKRDVYSTLMFRPQWKYWVQMSADEYWGLILEGVKSGLEKQHIPLTAIKPVELSL